MVLITNLGKNFAFTFVTAIGDEEIIGSALGSHCVQFSNPEESCGNFAIIILKAEDTDLITGQMR